MGSGHGSCRQAGKRAGTLALLLSLPAPTIILGLQRQQPLPLFKQERVRVAQCLEGGARVAGDARQSDRRQRQPAAAGAGAPMPRRSPFAAPALPRRACGSPPAARTPRRARRRCRLPAAPAGRRARRQTRLQGRRDGGRRRRLRRRWGCGGTHGSARQFRLCASPTRRCRWASRPSGSGGAILRELTGCVRAPLLCWWSGDECRN